MKHQAVMSYQGCHWSYSTSARPPRPEGHWSGTTSGTQKPVEFGEESRETRRHHHSRALPSIGKAPCQYHLLSIYDTPLKDATLAGTRFRLQGVGTRVNRGTDRS